MDERIERALRAVRSLDDLTRLQQNIERQNASTDEVRIAIRAKTADLGRALVVEKTGLDLSDLSPAEEKIIRAVSEYAGIQKRQGNPTTRTFGQLKNRGLLAAAEVSVMKSKPTQGFEALADADLADLSYEQIIVDHPEEFSARAQWYARRTLGLQNDSDTPPAPGVSLTQERTEKLIGWWRDRAAAHGGYLNSFTNAQAAAAIGLTDMNRHGRVFGNIQSRVDYACYDLGLPPLGLTATEPFDMAWAQGDRDWSFPIEIMQGAARERQWSRQDFDSLLRRTRELPGQAHTSWKRELNVNLEDVQAWASGLADAGPIESAVEVDEEADEPTSKRNPSWNREELILALNLYLQHRGSPPSKTSREVAELSALLNRLMMTNTSEAETFRNVNGVYMKMMNFRRFDPEYTADGRVGLTRGNKLEEVIWNEFSQNPSALATEVARILAGLPVSGQETAPYWVFVCNPKKWAIDRFLDKNIEYDTWGIRPSDRDRFAPGQLGIVRVGVDRRTIEERDGKPPLEAGIYAICEVDSNVFEGAEANDASWNDGAGREPGWPTVRIRYLRTYLHRPLTIERLRNDTPTISPLLLDGFQAASFPISADDFHSVVDLLGEDIQEIVNKADEPSDSSGNLTALQKKYIHASLEIKERVSKYIERGSVGSYVKKQIGFKCQVCEVLGRDPFGFKKKNGEPYVEAHHVMPVSELQIGSLAASNIMIVCANHHRQMHYGGIDVQIGDAAFEFVIEERWIKIPRFSAGEWQDGAN
ncbi:EVE domain-containing protein [Bradyrhizobium sp. 138]|uniref:EVE domain-containing protein n=1 Tax=Bradyrhizobium sp. 138 TaxID=2782615 RepID=UPI001FF71EDB|nr:EVE domain-containing protein [Bradyrhizobium sp. 138]MCK1732965.1 EVE domain-containing protein [Bradyrhizobium sp. 138]